MSGAPRVVVVGAGVAGLAAAWTLRERGCEVRVLERRRFAGGACHAKRIEGFLVERAAHVLSSADTDFVAWMRSVGAGDETLPLRPLLVSQVSHGTLRSIDESTLGGIARIPGVSWRDAARVIRLPRLMRRYREALVLAAPEAAEKWDYRSVADFARLYFGDSAYRAWVQPWAEAALLGDGEQLSRVGFMLEWERAQRGRPAVARQGMLPLVTAAAEGLDVALESEAVAVSEQGKQGFEVSLADGGSERADAVVLATSARDALQLSKGVVTPAERDVLSGLRVDPRVTLSVALERPISGVPQVVRVPRAENLSLSALVVEPGASDARAPQGCGLVTASASLGYARAGRDASHEVLEKGMRSDFERLFPRAPVRFTAIERDEAGTPNFDVGTFRSLARFERVQRDRCGSRSSGWPNRSCSCSRSVSVWASS